MPAKIKIEFCTSCGSQDIKVTGNKYYCPDCDITYIVITQGTKVIDSNPLGKEKDRIDKLENDVAQLKGKKEPGPEPTKPAASGDDAKQTSDKKEDEHDTGQDGFISIED